MKKLFLLLMVIFTTTATQNFASAKENYTDEYVVNAIKNKVEMNWVRDITKPEKSTVVSFTVNTDGSISPVATIRSSDDEAFDESVVKAVYKSVPFEYSSVINKPIAMQIFFSPPFLVANEIKTEPLSNNIVDVANKTRTIDFTDYLINLQTRVNDEWRPKSFAKERESTAIIKIDKDGSLSNPAILEPSHDVNFDRSALEAIAKLGPLDAFPANIKAPSTNVQLVFHYAKPRKKGATPQVQYVSARVLNVEGYDKYTDLVEQVLKNNLRGKNTILERRLVFEAEINRVGKLKYVKILQHSNSKMFNRAVYKVLQNSSFPQFPETITSDSITLKYGLITGEKFDLITGKETGIRIYPIPD